jgi:cardiolipin synthase A/B
LRGTTKRPRRVGRGLQDDPRFGEELGVLLGPPFLAGNRHKALQNGDEIFPSMLAAIRSAQTSVTFETCIYWSGAIGAEFSAALSERARQGVKVHVLLDWVGSAKAEQRLLDDRPARAGRRCSAARRAAAAKTCS